MDIKKRPNYKIYIQVLRQMSPEKRLLKAFELSEFTRQNSLVEMRSNLQMPCGFMKYSMVS